MSRDWAPEALNINREIVKSLQAGEVAYTDRFVGKTETLLAYIALHHDDAILITHDSNVYRRMWKARYPALTEPRFLTLANFEQRARGLTGTVFTDEVILSRELRVRLFGPHLRFGGGVCS